MSELVFPRDRFAALASQMLSEKTESCAILLGTAVPKGGGHRVLINEVITPPGSAYEYKTEISTQLKAEYVATVVRDARQNERSVTFVHSHPGDEQPHFSPIDDGGEELLAKFVTRRVPTQPHFALVLNRGGCAARSLGTQNAVSVIVVNSRIEVLYRATGSGNIEAHFDRQVRAFGASGQASIHGLTIGIVGLGGTGSATAQQLAYLGANRFILIDPDSVEATNLNRLVGATQSDIGKAKVDVAARNIRSISPEAHVDVMREDVLKTATAKRLIDADFIFCCTDSHGSRAVIGQLAYQYFIPCIDMGVSIVAKDSAVTHITGRVQMLAPGLGCLTCASLLDSDAVRRDLMTEEQRRADPYFLGNGAPMPAVVSLNLTMSSLAVTMFLGAVTGIPSDARFQIYDGVSGKMRVISESRDLQCIVCSDYGAAGRGNAWPLLGRP
jgi:hypothetical protein